MKITIVGAGEVGSHLAKLLRAAANEVTVIDNDATRISRVVGMADVATVNGSPTSLKVLQEGGAGKADLFIAVFPHARQEVNILSALLAKSIGAGKVIARINDEDYLSPENKLLFKEMGIELLFYPEKIAADEIEESLRHASISDSMDFAHGKLQVAVFKIGEESPMLDMKLMDFTSSAQSTGDIQFRVIAICRNEKTIIPHFDTKFQFNDVVYTIARREGIPTLMNLFGKSNVEVDKVMIVGGGAIAEMLARNLSRSISAVKIIENDKETCHRLASSLGPAITVSNGDCRNTDFLLEESIKDYDAFVALTDSDETNVLACVVAKKFGVGRTVAEVENIEYMRLAEDMGVDTVINEKLITAGRIFRFTLSGKARMVKYISGTSAEILEYTVAPGSRITKGALKDIGFPTDSVIGGVIRGNESFIAVGETTIEAYDRVVVFALGEATAEVDRFFRG